MSDANLPPGLGVITQARTTSTRLPGKVLMTAGGRTMLDHHLDRLEAAGLPVFLATTTNDTDEPIVDLAEARGVPLWRGSEDDVLDRYAGCIREYDLRTVVRVTSDCPLIDGAVIADAVQEFAAAGDPWLYVSNVVRPTYPHGMDFDVFSAAALLDAAEHATDVRHREHVTLYLNQNVSGRMVLRDVVRTPDASAYRLTLDTRDDLRLLRLLIEEHDAARLDVDGLVALLDDHPELVEINTHAGRRGVS